jgi:hypothetical protein
MPLFHEVFGTHALMMKNIKKSRIMLKKAIDLKAALSFKL